MLPLHAVFREVGFFSDSGCFPSCRMVVVCFPRITLFLAHSGLNAGELLGPTGPALQPLQVPWQSHSQHWHGLLSRQHSVGFPWAGAPQASQRAEQRAQRDGALP